MIKVEHLTKYYGQNKAVSDISFEIKKGELVGFLGPNGAGKSSTMRIMAGFLTPSEGNIYMDDKNILENPTLIKSDIGYLPENNPLYEDFTVEEYLSWILQMHKIPKDQMSSRITYAVDKCQLAEVYYKTISNLSKGYRQRVGLAAAIIHNPKILILDEPTSGLDPKQIREIRDLLKDLQKEHTILFSSHIMQEVEALCERVIIINKGQIIADGGMHQIGQTKSGDEKIVIRLQVSMPELESTTIFKKEYEIIESKNFDTFSEIILHLNKDKNAKQDLLGFIHKKAIPLTLFEENTSKLEDIFLSLTR